MDELGVCLYLHSIYVRCCVFNTATMLFVLCLFML